jgi:hypothetical protein
MEGVTFLCEFVLVATCLATCVCCQEVAISVPCVMCTTEWATSMRVLCLPPGDVCGVGFMEVWFSPRTTLTNPNARAKVRLRKKHTLCRGCHWWHSRQTVTFRIAVLRGDR